MIIDQGFGHKIQLTKATNIQKTENKRNEMKSNTLIYHYCFFSSVSSFFTVENAPSADIT